MPNWNEILDEIRASGSTHDIVRRKYLKSLQRLTGRNVIIYYSGWLQKPNASGIQVNDADKNGFMTVTHKLDRSKGLDLILHTPGGETAATESLVDYLRSMWGTNVRAIIPQLAMSAGTMIACSCNEIIMGKQSSLGPIDPQFKGIPAHGVVEEFIRAHTEIRADPSKAAVWQPIIAKYNPTLIGECEKAIDWSNQMVKEWLLSGMLTGVDNADEKANIIIEELGNHSLNKSHARHLSADKCNSIGLKITKLENDSKIQDAVLSIHHTCIHTLTSTNAFKIIENHNGKAFIQSEQQVILQRA
jgi:ATP-dependent protease ClpP protease subunit